MATPDDDPNPELALGTAARGPRARTYPGLSASEGESGRAAASDALVFTAGAYVAQVILFLAGIAQKRFLGPTGTGYWALMGTIFSFFSLASFGVFSGAVRQVPAHRGRGDYSAAGEVANTACTITLVAVSVTGGLATVMALAFGSAWPDSLRYGIVLLGITAPLRTLVDCHELVYQATKRFTALSLTTVAKAVVALSVQTLFAYLWGLYGMFAGVVAISIAALALYDRLGLTGWAKPAFRLGVARDRVRELVWAGIPLMMFSQIWLLFIAADSLIVAGFVSVTSLGYYALAVSVTNYIIILPRSIAAAVFPRMQERFARKQDVASVQHYATGIQGLLAWLLVPPFIAAAYFLLPVLIRRALPAFTPSIDVVHIMVAASFLIALVHMPTELLITINRRWSATAIMLIGLLVNVGANYLVVGIWHKGITGAAWATALSYLVLLSMTTAYGLAAGLGGRDAIHHLLLVLACVGYSLGLLWGIETALGHGASIASDLALGIAKWLLFLLLCAPWFLYAERRFHGVTTLAGLLKQGARYLRRETSDVTAAV